MVEVKAEAHDVEVCLQEFNIYLPLKSPARRWH